MDIFEKKTDTPPRTCKTKGGKEVDAEKYKAICDKLELARSTRAKKLAESKLPKQEEPKQEEPKQEAKPTDDKLSKAMCLLALQDKKIKELTEKLNPPKPEIRPEVRAPEPSAPIDIPKPKPQPYQRHWALSDD